MIRLRSRSAMAENIARKLRPSGVAKSSEGKDGSASIQDALDDVQAIPHRPGSAIPFCEHQAVAGRLKLVKSSVKLRPSDPALARRLVLEEELAGLSLARQLLGLRADAAIPDQSLGTLLCMTHK